MSTENSSKPEPTQIHGTAIVPLPRVTIRFCVQCKWNLRAAYVSEAIVSIDQFDDFEKRCISFWCKIDVVFVSGFGTSTTSHFLCWVLFVFVSFSSFEIFRVL